MSEAIGEADQAAILDPRDNKLPRLIGETLVYLRRYAEADAAFNRALVLSPDDLETQVYQATALQMRGELEAAGRVLAAIPADSDPEGSVSFMRYQIALSMHQPDAALGSIAHAPAWLSNLWASNRQPVTLLRGQALALKGETGPAREAFQQAQHSGASADRHQHRIVDVAHQRTERGARQPDDSMIDRLQPADG